MRKGIHNRKGMLRAAVIGGAVGVLVTAIVIMLAALLMAKGTIGEGLTGQMTAIAAIAGSIVGAFVAVQLTEGRIVLSAAAAGLVQFFVFTAVGAAMGDQPLQGSMPVLLLFGLVSSAAVGVIKATYRKRH